jgi:Redoxin
MSRVGLRVAGRTVVAAACAASAVAWLATGCARPPSKELQPGSYRAVLDLPGHRSLPFALDIAREESGPVLYLVNGSERVRVTELVSRPGTLTARMPGYETTLSTTVSGGVLKGTVTFVHAEGRAMQLPFEATLGETWRFFPEPLSDNADVSGRWDVTFLDDAGRRTRAVAEFTQRFEQVTGTVLLPANDQRFLAGEVHDDELRLSRFDGGAALLYHARLNTKGELVGESWSDRGGHQRFVARRNPDANVDAFALATQLRNPDAGFQFEFRDLDGQPVSSRDPRFEGKVTLVTLAGSWSPNSHDEADVLVTLERKYRERGFAVVSLMFEQHDVFDRAVAAIRRFRSAHGIQYPTLAAGRMDDAQASRALPQLDGVRAYPTTIFIDRTGRVRRIHTGFSGPATGVRHARLVQDFEHTIEALLAETGGGAPASLKPSPGNS